MQGSYKDSYRIIHPVTVRASYARAKRHNRLGFCTKAKVADRMQHRQTEACPSFYHAWVLCSSTGLTSEKHRFVTVNMVDRRKRNTGGFMATPPCFSFLVNLLLLNKTLYKTYLYIHSST